MSLPSGFFFFLILQSQRGQESFLSCVAYSFSFLFIIAPEKFNISTFNFLYHIWKNDKGVYMTGYKNHHPQGLNTSSMLSMTV